MKKVLISVLLILLISTSVYAQEGPTVEIQDAEITETYSDSAINGFPSQIDTRIGVSGSGTHTLTPMIVIKPEKLDYNLLLGPKRRSINLEDDSTDTYTLSFEKSSIRNKLDNIEGTSTYQIDFAVHLVSGEYRHTDGFDLDSELTYTSDASTEDQEENQKETREEESRERNSDIDPVLQRSKLIHKVHRLYWDLDKKEYAVLSGVPPSLIPTYPLSAGTVEEKTSYLRSRASSLNWNYGAKEAVSTWKEQVRKQPEEKHPDGPEDVSVSGNTYFVSSDTGHVMRDGNAARHCYESLNYFPPNHPPKNIFPQMPTNYSSLNPDTECPSWVSNENTDWIPNKSELKQLGTYCPADEEDENAVTAINEDLKVSYINKNCVLETVAPICGEGEGEICSALNEDICNRFGENCEVPRLSGSTDSSNNEKLGRELGKKPSYASNTIVTAKNPVRTNSEQIIYAGLTNKTAQTPTDIAIDLPSSTEKFKIPSGQNYFKKTVSTGNVEGEAVVKLTSGTQKGIFDRLFDVLGGPQRKVLAEKNFTVNKLYVWESVCERTNSNFDDSRKFSMTAQCMNDVWSNCGDFEENCTEIRTSVCSYGNLRYDPKTKRCVSD